MSEPEQASAKPKTRRRTTRQSPDVRRQDLVEVTIRCLARFGPRGATGREICRQAGVSHGLLRHYFNNPDNLLLETYQEVCERVLHRFEEVLAKPDNDPWETIDQLFEVLFSDEWSNSDIWGAWIAFWTLVRSNDDFAQVSEAFNGRLLAILQTAVSRLPPGPVAPAEMAALLSAVMDGLWLDFCLSSTRVPRDRALQLGRLMVRQLVPQPVAAE